MFGASNDTIIQIFQISQVNRKGSLEYILQKNCNIPCWIVKKTTEIINEKGTERSAEYECLLSFEETIQTKTKISLHKNNNFVVEQVSYSEDLCGKKRMILKINKIQ